MVVHFIHAFASHSVIVSACERIDDIRKRKEDIPFMMKTKSQIRNAKHMNGRN